MLPDFAAEKLEELEDLCRENPHTIKTELVAKFLHMDPNSLRTSIIQGKCPFGLSWIKNPINGNNGFCVNTLTFYIWATNGIGLKDRF